MEILISGSIVLYKNQKSVKKTIKSFLDTSLKVKMLLIDNSPTDGLRLELEEFCSDQRVEYIFNDKNIGFGAGHNIALKKMTGCSKYHLVLNPDVSFDPNVLETICRFMERNKEVGLLMPKVIYPDGSLQYLCRLLPSPILLIFRRFLPSLLLKGKIEDYELRRSNYDIQMEVPYLSGCFMFMRASTLAKVGLFDERFFLYLEDTDLSRRFSVYGQNVFFPEVTITHEHGRGSYKYFNLLIIHTVSAVKYFNKWGWWNDKLRKRINEEALVKIYHKPKLKKAIHAKAV